MSRGPDRSEPDRSPDSERDPEPRSKDAGARRSAALRPKHIRDTHPRDREGRAPDRWSPAARLTLPRGRERQPVGLGSERFSLRATEVDLLATVGAFRVVCERDLAPERETTIAQDVRSLRDQGLLDSRSVVINGTPERIFALTDKGRDLLEHHRAKARDVADVDDERQAYYSGFLKPRELAHDAQLYRLFTTERDQLEAEGATVIAVSLDAELKRDYHRFVEERVGEGEDRDEARREFAEEHELPFSDGRIGLPDLRIEYETPEGERAHRDVELATENYSHSQLAGKQSAGFRVYRAAGTGVSDATSRGSTPNDPHHLEWLS